MPLKFNFHTICVALILLLFLFFYLGASSQNESNPTIDSLLTLINKDKEDTNKINHINILCREYLLAGTYDTALFYGNVSLRLSNKLNYTSGASKAYNCIGCIYSYQGKHNKSIENFFASLKILKNSGNANGIANCYYNIGISYRDQGNFQMALENFSLSLKIREEAGDKNEISELYLTIGDIYWRQGIYDTALNKYLIGLKIAEEIKDQEIIANSLNKIGIIYKEQKKYNKSLEYYFKALTIWNKLDNKIYIADLYINIGSVYNEQKNNKAALEYYLSAIKLFNEVGEKEGIASTYNNIGNVYDDQGDYEKALENHFSAIKIRIEIDDKYGFAESYLNIGNVYFHKRDYHNSLDNMHKSIEISYGIRAKDLLMHAYKSLSDTYNNIYDYKKAYKYHKLYTQTKDSLFNEESHKQIAEMQTKYETEKKEKEIELLSKDREIHQVQLSRQQTMLWSAFGGLILVLILAFFIFRSYKQKQKANLLLESKNIAISQKNEEIEKQKSVIEDAHKIVQKKNEEITDSITVAKRIQESMLMSEEEIQRMLPFDTFVFFRPKDIVSGDFYWFNNQGEKYFVAAVDCTGHGVPGAFMSMIGNSLLNEIVNEMKITKPAEILNQLNKLVSDTLQQSKDHTQAQDGMDIALCSIDIKNRILEYAGARNPLYIIENEKINIIKADPLSIGGITPSILQGKERAYTNHEFPLTENMSFYLFSDGYCDQHGGLHRKKLGSQQFKTILLGNSNKNSFEQQSILANEIERWKNNNKQTDDILVIGCKIKL